MRMVFTESDQQREFTVPAGTKLTVGRQKQCGLSIRDLSISKEHAELELAGDKLRIRDLGSRNGTWVNGERVGDQFVDVSLSDNLIIGKVPVALMSADGGISPMETPDMDEEGTMFDPDFGSAAAWQQQQTPQAPPPVPGAPPPGGGGGQWSPPPAGGGGLSGQVFEPGLPATSMSIGPGTHFIGTDSSCSVQLSASGVSGSHAKLDCVNGQWWLEDLGSKNGTYVNKQLVTRTMINPGDTIFVGPVRIELAGASAAAAPAAMGAPGVPAAAPGAVPGAAGGGGIKPLYIVVGIFVVLIGGLGALKAMKPQDNGGGGSGSAVKPRDNMAQFKNAVKTAVDALNKANYRDASQYLAAAHALKKTSITQTLMEINTIMQDDPTSQITEMIEKFDKLRALQNKVWTETGVKTYAETQYAKWKDEQDNATYASKMDAAFDRGDWREARKWFKKIKRNSEFKVARQKKETTAKTKIAEELRDEGDALMKAGRADEAVVKYQQAIDIAPNDMQNELITLRQKAAANQRFAQMLRKGQEAMNAGSLGAAKTHLEGIPETSVYFKKAVELLEQINRMQIKDQAMKLYQTGEGDKALKLLANAVSDELRALREQIDRVHRVYTQAQQLYEQEKYAQANELWVALKNLVGDQSNQYFKWAEAGIRVDPIKLAEQLAKDARLLYSRGQFIEAGIKNSKSLQFNGKNADALKLKKEMTRKVSLKYSIARQNWQNSNDNAAFLPIAIECYRWLRATDAINRQLPKMAEAIIKAGGKVPPPEKKKDDDD